MTGGREGGAGVLQRLFWGPAGGHEVTNPLVVGQPVATKGKVAAYPDIVSHV